LNESSGSLPSVIVPVYNAADELQACLASLAETVREGSDVVIIDDASPASDVRAVLQSWNERRIRDWRFYRNESNLGFVGTANRGMELCREDVVLLNSDTVVTPGWLEGLGRCLASDPSIATATPWTNNGEIASLPAFCQANPLPPDLNAVAEIIGSTGRAVYPDLPTAVGFCMAISRAAIDLAGLFDLELFGKGYGEENDFSMRVAGLGMRNVLCDDVYVAHVGGSSFGPTGLKPGEESMRRLLSRHPGYLELVQEFIAGDPLAERRDALVQALHRAGVRLG
jgi:GT2 family glycosyltransferase